VTGSWQVEAGPPGCLRVVAFDPGEDDEGLDVVAPQVVGGRAGADPPPGPGRVPRRGRAAGAGRAAGVAAVSKGHPRRFFLTAGAGDASRLPDGGDERARHARGPREGLAAGASGGVESAGRGGGVD